MSVVAHFPGNSIPRIGEVSDIVEMLETALKQARDGDIVALGLVKVRRQPLSFAQSYHTEPGTSHTFAAGVMSLAHRIGGALNPED